MSVCEGKQKEETLLDAKYSQPNSVCFFWVVRNCELLTKPLVTKGLHFLFIIEIVCQKTE